MVKRAKFAWHTDWSDAASTRMVSIKPVRRRL